MFRLRGEHGDGRAGTSGRTDAGSQNVESGCVPESCEDHLKMYGKRPERRYPNAAAVISDLRRALLNDDDPTIGAVKEEDHSSDTIVISPKELNLIKTRSGGTDPGVKSR